MPGKNIEKLQIILTNYDKVMSGKKVQLKISDLKGHKAGRHQNIGSGHKIDILVNDDSIESMVLAKSLNLHELGHALFTRELRTLLNHEVLAHNILEDQRIEWILANRYYGMRKYFVYAVHEMIGPKRYVEQKNLLWGRRFFLPFKVEKPDGKIPDIIDKFLVAKTQAIRLQLAKQFAKELGLQDSQGNLQTQNSGSEPQNTLKQGHGETGAEQQGSDSAKKKIGEEKKEERKQKRVEKKEQAKAEKEKGEGGEGNEDKGTKDKETRGTGEKSEDDTEGTENTKRPQGDQDNGSDDDKKSEDGDKTDADKGDGAGFSDAPSDKEAELLEELSDLLTDALDEVGNELSIPIEKLKPKKQKKSVQRSSGDWGQIFSMDKSLEETNITIDANLDRELTEVFRTARVGLQGNWHKHQRAGRLNMREAMTESGNLRIFKKYQPSRVQDSKISLVIIYDHSSSMITNDRNMIELKSVAAMTSASTKAGNETAVIGFNSVAHIAKSFDSTKMELRKYTGNTNPHTAVDVFKNVKKLAKNPIVLIIMTDGDFDKSYLPKDVIEGVRLYKILIGHSRMALNEQYKSWISVNDTKVLPNVLKAILKDVEHNVVVGLVG